MVHFKQGNNKSLDRDGAARTRIRACRLPPHFLFGAPEGDVHEYADPFGDHHEFLLSGVAAVPAIPCLPGDRADHFRVDLREPATFVVDERRRKWLFIGNGCGAPVRLVLASHRTDDG